MAAATTMATAAATAAATTGVRPSGLINLPPAGEITSPIFDPPSSCNQLTTSSEFSSQLWLGYQEDCFPPDYFAIYAETTGRAYYSPALCPIGWTAYPWVDTSFGPPPTAGETIMDCCQSGVTPASFQVCEGVATGPTTAQFETSGLYSSVASITGTTSILANLIQIRYQSTDCSVLGICSGSKSSSSSSSSKSSSTTSHSGSPTPPPPPPPPPSKGGLSTGAKAAIGVVIPVVVIAALLLAFFLVRRRKQKQAREKAVAPDHQAPQMGMAPQQQPQYYQGQPGMPHSQYQGYPPPDQQQLDKGMIVGGGPIQPNYSGEQSVNGNKHFSTQTTGTMAQSPSAPQYASQVGSPTSPAPIYEAPGHDPISPAPVMESPSQFKAQPADEFYVPHVPVAPSGQAEADEAAAIQKELDEVRAERKRISTMEELSRKETELQERLNKVGGPAP